MCGKLFRDFHGQYHGMSNFGTFDKQEYGYLKHLPVHSCHQRRHFICCMCIIQPMFSYFVHYSSCSDRRNCTKNIVRSGRKTGRNSGWIDIRPVKWWRLWLSFHNSWDNGCQIFYIRDSAHVPLLKKIDSGCWLIWSKARQYLNSHAWQLDKIKKARCTQEFIAKPIENIYD